MTTPPTTPRPPSQLTPRPSSQRRLGSSAPTPQSTPQSAITTDQATDPTRKADLAKIHIAKTQLQLTQDDYRALLNQLYQTPTSSTLTPQQRTHLLAHFTKLGAPTARARQPGKTFTPTTNKQHRLVYAQWAELGRLGALKTPTPTALHAFVKNRYQVERLGWLGTLQTRELIELLKSWIARQNTTPKPPEKSTPKAAQNA